MRKQILICLALIYPLCCFGQTEYPLSGNDCGEHCSWKIEDGVLTLTGYGKIKDYGHNTENIPQPWYWDHANITKVVIENESETNQFTRVGSGAFEWLGRVKEIVLPESIQTIGEFACYNCTGLEKVNLPNGLQTIGTWAFGQAKLSEIDIPETVQRIDDWAFQLTDLTSVVIPENTNLGENAFFNDSRVVGPSTTPITTIYCTQKNIEQCRKAVAYRGDDAKVFEYEKVANGQYFVNGKWYENLNDMNKGNHVKKRIYTLDEANKISGKNNMVKIRYK